ncbi:polycystin-1-like protein 2 isoform X1 [Acipenser ruthenus]|uniref:polycystin-1-like protein 2 isoform X1 n=1 Tax=Acipenser ruthenus TaxID=7906 RepID=UPI002741D6F9|nr:polycystin-1-like protein 2 isoform X1 [Acipenser ruthenus]
MSVWFGTTMSPALLRLLSALLALIFQAWGQGSSAAPLCSEYQEGFEDSCYEFVGFQRSFHSAQGWCERGGGHLAFILNDETQQFLQKHLQPDRDWWIGLAPATENLTRESAAAEGPLSWLDGSDVSYANWKTAAPAAVQCGHILKDSGYQWEATSNCSQELYFVCEFESGRSLACVEYNATLQCGSGQVIQIDDSFYGRKTLHYCRQPISPPSPAPEEECSWVDVADLVAGHCHGLQVCQAVADVASFGEPCPGLGSYLSVEYHCKEGLQLLVGELVPVFENVTITLRWLLFPFTGNLTCSLSAGDGRIIDPYSPAQSNSSVVHRYTRAGVFTVSVECTTSEWHVAAQKTISVQEPISEFGTIRCYSKNQWRDSLNCSVLYGSTLQIQVELEAGTNVTYTVLSGNALLAKSTALRGIMPHNLTIDTTTQQQMGPGSHLLTILASNNVTAPDVTVELEVLFVEPVQGLQAMLTSRDDIVLGNDLQISVSISHGAPVELVFQFVGLSNYSRKKELKDSQAKVFSFRTNFEGTFHVTVSASNGFSEMSLAIGSQTVIPNPSSASNVTEEPVSDTESEEEEAEVKRSAGPSSGINSKRHKDEHDRLRRGGDYTRCNSLYGENKDVKVHISCLNCSYYNRYKPVSLKAYCDGSCSKIDWYYVDYDNEGDSNDCQASMVASNGSNYFLAGRTCIKPHDWECKVRAIGVSGLKYGYVDYTFKMTQAVSSYNQQNSFEILQQGMQSGPATVHLYQNITSTLNQDGDIEGMTARAEMREQLLLTMSATFNESYVDTMQAAVQAANVLKSLVQRSDEVTPSAQLHTSSFLYNLTKSLLSLKLMDSGKAGEMTDFAMSVVTAAGSILEASGESLVTQTQTSYLLISTLGNVKNALLSRKPPDQEPFIVTSEKISLYANRLSLSSLSGTTITTSNTSKASFTLPAIASSFSEDKTVDVQMISFSQNPFSWGRGEAVVKTVGELSLSRENGSTILVSNLTEDIEIFLPRPYADPVKSTVLVLGNFSTVMVNVTAGNPSLVLKLDLAREVPLQLYLGFQYHPNETSFDAETQLPDERYSGGDRYTWVLNPDNLSSGVGVYYILLRPSWNTGPISTNTTVSVTSFAVSCMYWDELSSNWNMQGCRVGPLTTYNVTQCLCNHLTSFGSSFFVMPNAVDVSRSAELFASFSSNPVVVCTVASLIGVYILVIIWARRKDIKDADKVKITVLEDNDPLAQYRYMLTVSTGQRRGASTSAQVTVTLNGSEGESDPHHLTDPEKPVFERGETDMFLLTTPFSLGELQSLRLWHDNTGSHPAWYVNRVLVHDLETDQTWQFLCNSWLAIDVGECVLDKVFPVATEADLKQFSNLFFMKTTKDFRDGHLWFSVLSRPPSSNFTCVQRVSCCFSLLLCTMLTSIIFYGVPTDPSEQKMDLGGFTITWHQVMIGFESSILVFPINLLIVTIFRKVRPREKKDQKKEDKQQDKTEHGKTVRVSPSQPPSPQSVPRELTPESVIKDIKRLAQSLSKAMKSPVPLLDKDFGKTTDINQLLSMVEEIIHQQNRAGEEFYNESHKKDSSHVLTLGAVDLQESSRAENQAKTPVEAQRRNDYNQYLYRQLEHVERELELLGPKRFSTPQSYSQAVQQVQGMKGLLKRQLSSSATDRLSQCPGPTDADVQKKGCQKGLPWWFVFLGWLLVLASSSVSAYFTMLYGLHYGKQGSINWLISMSVSFFESLFLTQPLKVLGLALFFALVLKRVDPEEESEGPIDRMLTSSGDPGIVLSTRRDSSCSLYHPPPPTDIEKMKNNMLKEQKVFALIREIVAYIGFLWMLLLVAYGQRDPNGYFLTSHIRQSFTSDLSDSMKHGDFFNWANSTLLSNLYGPYPGFITDGNSKLVGSARMRQVRVQKDSCPVTRSMRSTVRDCHAPYSWDLEDMDSYGPGWNISAPRNTSQFSSVWKYQSQGSLRAHPLWGNIALYRGGGYVAVLGTDIDNATSVLQYLIDNTWLDEYTRAIFVEFTVYNANLNLFCIVNVMLETSAVGAFQPRAELHNVRLYQGTGGLQYFVMGSEIIYFLFIIYYMVLQGRLMKEQRWAYFKSKCNLLDLAIIVLSWSALCMFINRTILGNRDVEYYQNHRDQFASFYETATADSALGYIIAFLVLLATVKMWHLMRLNPKLNMITATLRRAWTDISGFINVIVIMLLSYSIATNLMFGWKLYSYRSLQEAALTMVSLQLGFFNYQEVLDYNPVLGAFMIGSCIIFMSFVVLNLFISVILVAFSEEQQQHQPSEEEEIVDMMIEKLCSLFGIKLKKRESNTEDSLKK